MDPLSIFASLLAVATAGIQSSRSLKETIERFKARDPTLHNLLHQVSDLDNILSSLQQLLHAAEAEPALATDVSVAKLLLEPIKRCSADCGNFEKAMDRFKKNSKVTFVDWAKMEFMRGDINQFMDTVAAYKATISIGLGVFTMHSVKLTRQALEQYEEMIKDTTYTLNLRLQRIDDRMASWGQTSDTDQSNMEIDLTNERDVTKQCLRICEDAKTYLESLTTLDSTLRQEHLGPSVELQKQFEAQLLTRRTLDNNQASLAKIITHLRERLESVVFDGSSTDRSRLEEDIQASKQCLELCNLASDQVNKQKIHIIGEAVADGESDHMVVTTLADVFNVGKTSCKNRSAMLVGSMSDGALMQLSRDRYNSRFGAASTADRASNDQTAVSSETPNVDSTHKNKDSFHQRSPPSSNETRKRMKD